jgi:hypothetical protein
MISKIFRYFYGSKKPKTYDEVLSKQCATQVGDRNGSYICSRRRPIIVDGKLMFRFTWRKDGVS